MADNLVHPINFLISTSISTETFPTKWKFGHIIPLYKGKGLPKHTTSSYRPITLLPVLSKIIERSVQEQIVNHMNTHKLFHPKQYAFRKGFSTASALIEMADQLFEAAKDKHIGVAISIDQSSAFDSLSHTTLLKKLELYRMDGNTRNFHISQFVEIGTKHSQMKPAPQGVPQGSVLWSILFAIYINEMHEVVRRNSCRMEAHSINNSLFGPNCKLCGTIMYHADDSTYIASSNTRLANQGKLDENMENFKIFLNSNQLCINEGKTSLLETMNPQKRWHTTGNPPPSL